MSRPSLLLPKVRLRRLRPEDRKKTFDWRNMPDIYRWCRQNDVLHLLKHESWFTAQAQDNSMTMYGVESEDEKFVGVCGLTSIDNINGRAEFSLYIGPEFQGMGYGEAALRALCSKGFNDYRLNSIWGESFEDNPAIKMFFRVGFKEEGRRRQFYYRSGRYIDAILFSMLRDEYVAQGNRTNPGSVKPSPSARVHYVASKNDPPF